MKRSDSVSWKSSPSKKGDYQPKRSASMPKVIFKEENDDLLNILKDKPSSTVKSMIDSYNDSVELKNIDDNDFFTFSDISSEFESNHYEKITFKIKEIEKCENTIKLKDDEKICTLEGEWTEIDFVKGMNISVYKCHCCINSNFTDEKSVVVNDKENLLMIEDDLITTTMLCRGIQCLDQAFLNEKIQNISFQKSNLALAVGIILHSVIEKCFLENNFSVKFIMETLQLEIKKSIEILFVCGSDEAKMMNECMKYIKNLVNISKLKLKAVSCEEKVYSNRFFLKGTIDLLISENNHVIPMEIKTGKTLDVTHRAQVIVYDLILRELKSSDHKYCYLYYAFHNQLSKVQLKHNEIQSIIIKRNDIASLNYKIKYQMKDYGNPLYDVKKYDINCNCNSINLCKRFFGLLKNTNSAKFDFLRKQWDAVSIEEYSERNYKRYRFIFIEQEKKKIIMKNSEENDHTMDGHIEIFSENNYKICNARVVDSDGKTIELLLYEEIDLSKHKILLVSVLQNILFYKTLRFSILQIANVPQLDYIFEPIKDACSFSTQAQTNTYFHSLSINSSIASYKESIPAVFNKEFVELNIDQQKALLLALNTTKYQLIHGFPGSGKSKLIALMIKILNYKQKSILLVCYTNLAIDNILKRINIDYYRALKEDKKFSSVAELTAKHKKTNFVVSTNFGFSDIIFVEKKFDFCILDEATQQNMLLSLIPISISSKFILVGDPLQLKPLSHSSEDLKICLFEHLIDRGSVVQLKQQYRMGEEIMRISNKMFYENKMIGFSGKSSIKVIDTSLFDGLEEIIKANIDEKTTIICYFNATVNKLKKFFDEKYRIETIDRFQGSEDDNIILVLDPIKNIELMHSRERLNVALTRARKKLIIIGNKKEMKNIKILNELLQNLE